MPVPDSWASRFRDDLQRHGLNLHRYELQLHGTRTHAVLAIANDAGRRELLSMQDEIRKFVEDSPRYKVISPLVDCMIQKESSGTIEIPIKVLPGRSAEIIREIMARFHYSAGIAVYAPPYVETHDCSVLSQITSPMGIPVDEIVVYDCLYNCKVGRFNGGSYRWETQSE